MRIPIRTEIVACSLKYTGTYQVPSLSIRLSIWNQPTAFKIILNWIQRKIWTLHSLTHWPYPAYTKFNRLLLVYMKYFYAKLHIPGYKIVTCSMLTGRHTAAHLHLRFNKLHVCHYNSRDRSHKHANFSFSFKASAMWSCMYCTVL